MRIPGVGANSHHITTYGDPSIWPYNNFLDGARDKAGNWVQFAPKSVSQGGKFDPDAWAQQFVDAGAKFAGPVSEHHDGFSMRDSAANEWKSVRHGPGLNLLALFRDAVPGKAWADPTAFRREKRVVPLSGPGGGTPVTGTSVVLTDAEKRFPPTSQGELREQHDKGPASPSRTSRDR